MPPAADGWPPIVDAALTADAAWAPDLAARLPLTAAITALATPADTTAMVTCHRDLHPDNVLVIHDTTVDAGQLAVIDWDNLGPADPSRELVRVLLDWFFDNERSTSAPYTTCSPLTAPPEHRAASLTTHSD